MLKKVKLEIVLAIDNENDNTDEQISLFAKKSNVISIKSRTMAILDSSVKKGRYAAGQVYFVNISNDIYDISATFIVTRVTNTYISGYLVNSDFIERPISDLIEDISFFKSCELIAYNFLFDNLRRVIVCNCINTNHYEEYDYDFQTMRQNAPTMEDNFTYITSLSDDQIIKLEKLMVNRKIKF